MTISFLDFIFPKKCVSCGKLGSYICKDCYRKIEIIEKPVCPVCQRQAIGGKTHPGCYRKWRLDGLVVGARYKDPIAVAIKKVKYKWIYDIEKMLGDILITNLWRFDLPEDYLMIPVPLHSHRERWRGFNQAKLLCEYFSKRFGQKSLNILERFRETKPQVGLSREARKKNIAGAFRISADAKIGGRNFILVDDVFTSGATIAECAKVLKKAGAKSVWGMAIALG